MPVLITAESSTAAGGNISDLACDATVTGSRIEDTNSIKMETTTPYNGKCTIEL